MIVDYAKTTFMDKWFRHPVMGDPSFDTFERLGNGAVHRSEPPYEWAVNTSIFCDFDGTWYCYPGLYHMGYAFVPGQASRFRIYRSKDKGATWEDLGFGLESGYCFPDYAADGMTFESCPDVVLCYDERHHKYLLTYDTSSSNNNWTVTYDDPTKNRTERGAALAWADTPAGPFTRIPDLFLKNTRVWGSCGRWIRLYASTVLPREKDYIAFCLCDSDEHFTWGLTTMTAPTPEGPWSMPHMVLSCERPEYYPCPVEFHPVSLVNGTVYASATSVAMNRNYQAVFAAPLEQAHDPSAWRLTDDGNMWHAFDHPDDYYGIWGQTYHGCLDNDTGRYVVSYPSKDARNYGVISIATRPWNQPHSDGFTMTAHGGPSISPLLTAYDDFCLETTFEAKGTVDFAFGYHGILGPHDNKFDAMPHAQAMAGYSAVRVEGETVSVIDVSPEGKVTVYASDTIDTGITGFALTRCGDTVTVTVNDSPVELTCRVPVSSGTLALLLQCHSRITCGRFVVNGVAKPYALTVNAVDALLNAGQLHPDNKVYADNDRLPEDRWQCAKEGYIGEGLVAAKWNVIGSRFTVHFRSSPDFGTAGIWVDGIFWGSVPLDGTKTPTYVVEGLTQGRHAVRVAPLKGRIAIVGLTMEGDPSNEITPLPTV